MLRLGVIKAMPLPGFALLGAVVLLTGIDRSIVFDPPALLPLLNFLFLFACPMVAWYVASRAYLSGGATSLLLLGGGLFSFGIGSLFAGFGLLSKGPNAVVTLHNCAALMAGVLHLSGALLAVIGVQAEEIARRRRRNLALAYSAIMAVLATLVLLAFHELLPPFFIQGQGATPLRQAVLGTAALSFLLSGLLFLRLHSTSRNSYLSWYSMALLLIFIGLSCIFVQKSFGGPVGWIGRTAQYLGGIYLLMAVLRGAREHGTEILRLDKVLSQFFRTRFELLLEERMEQLRLANEQLQSEIGERRRAEEALRTSEALFRSLFDHHEAVKLLIDPDTGRIIDGNPAAADFYGWPREQLRQMNIRDINTLSPEEIQVNMAKVMSKRQTHFEFRHRRADGSIRDVEVFSGRIETREGDLLHSIVHDITQRKRADSALKESEENARRSANDSTIMAEIGRIINSSLDIEEVYERFAEEVRKLIPFDRISINMVNLKDNTISLDYFAGIETPGRPKGTLLPLSGSLGEYILSTRRALLIGTEEVEDYARRFSNSMPSLQSGVQSLIVVPLISKGEGIGIFYIRSTKPDVYSERDLKLAERLGSFISSAVANARLYEEQQRGEAALRESQTLLRTIIDSTPDMIWSVDPERFGFMTFNRGLEEYFLSQRGIRIERGMRPEDVFPTAGEEAEQWRGFYRRALLEGPYTMEHKVDIGTRIVQVRFSLLMNQDGRVFGISVFCRDITDQKLAEQGLRRSEERFSKAFRASPHIIAITRIEDGLIIDISEAVEKVLGYRRDELVGKSSLELWVDPDQRGTVLRTYSVEKKLQNREVRFRAKDGRIVFCSISLEHIELDGQTFILSVTEDITERRRLEEARRAGDEKFAKAFHQSPLAMAIFTLEEGRFLDVNAQFLRVFEWSREEVVGRTPVELGIWTDLQQRLEVRKQIEERGSVHNFEQQARTKSGRIVTLLYSCVKIVVNDEMCLLASGIDITEQKKTEKEKEKLQTQLAQAQKMEAIGTLAGGIAHDFNNVLGIILGYAELTLMDTEKGSRNWENLNEVYKAAERARDLVKQILTFSRQAPQEKKPLRVDLVVKEALKFLRSSLPSTIEIRRRIGENLGKVMGDFTQIHQVVMNLCVNAGHAMKEKGGVLSVELNDVELGMEDMARFGITRPGPYCRLRVSDTGHGMDAATLGRIFEPFFTTKAPEEGTGLGLAVVHGVIKSHGGGILVESEPGKGTTFEIMLPGMGKTPDIRTPAETAPPPGRGERILVVDDEPGMARMYEAMLKSLGYAVEVRTSSKEALQAFTAKPDEYDLLLTDMTMPQMTGLDLSKHVLTVRPHMPIVLLTGFSEGIDEEKIKAQGIMGLLLKPIGRKQMAEQLEKVFRR